MKNHQKSVFGDLSSEWRFIPLNQPRQLTHTQYTPKKDISGTLSYAYQPLLCLVSLQHIAALCYNNLLMQ